MNLTFDHERHEYRLDGTIIPSTTQVLVSEGYIDTTFMQEHGRDRGSMSHLAIRYFLEGRLDFATVDMRIAPYVDGATKFVSDMGFVPHIIEKHFAHPIYRYGLTPDTVGTVRQFGDNLVLIDWKTGVPHPATVLQMASYLEGLRANGIEVKHIYIIYLKEDATYTPELVKVTQHEVGVFLSALACMNWKNNHLKGRNNVRK